MDSIHRLNPCPRIEKEMTKTLKVDFFLNNISYKPLIRIDMICDENSGISNFIDSAYGFYINLLIYLNIFQPKLFLKGGSMNCKKEILQDFFRYAFDGSGSDNFFEAGSCIDGRFVLFLFFIFLLNYLF
jgi:hypothetical protein